MASLVTEWEDPILLRRDRQPTITVRADIRQGVQPPVVTAAILPKLAALKASLPPGYAIATAGTVEEAGKANAALAPIFPVMVLLMLTVIMLQTRSFRMTGLVFATAPLGLIGAAPALALMGMPFGFNAILGLIGLAGILMRNTLILVDQIEAERLRGLDQLDAVVEATVRRARPVLLTALAAVLAFLPLTLSSFWGTLAVVLIGGTLVGTALTLFFLPALYALWFVGRRTPGPSPTADGLAAQGA
ncbi:MAG: acrB/AcrD/AcrF family protein [Caulobacter sp.]|nr:acrB/AcrD/AcrF family protein [Caulobacter sp.]